MGCALEVAATQEIPGEVRCPTLRILAVSVRAPDVCHVGSAVSQHSGHHTGANGLSLARIPYRGLRLQYTRERSLVVLAP